MNQTKAPPLDQRIVDEYFHLIQSKKAKTIAWLFGMIATYGIKPEELEGFTWNADNTINIKSKKRSIYPLHPQWVFLFNLNKKQPLESKDCWDTCVFNLYRSMASTEISVNVTDLILGYQVRKALYHPKQITKRQPKAALVFA